VLGGARLPHVEGLCGDGAIELTRDLRSVLSNVDRVAVGLRVAWLEGHGAILVVVVEVEPLGGVDVVNAHVVLVNPAGV